jgi:three-Cys-motif partner protein
MAILSRQASKLTSAGRIGYVDGFAGPGRSLEGEPGSPLIALDAAIDHSQQLPEPIRMLFIEKRPDRFAYLDTEVAKYRRRIDLSPHVERVQLECADCEEYLQDLLGRYDRDSRKFGPALVFLDQFGYSAVSMSLIGRILRHAECEVFTFLNWRDLNRFITDEAKWPGITRAFGDESWKSVLSMPIGDRESFLLGKYRSALENLGGAEFFCSFAMHDIDGRLLYWLFFCSGHLRGLEEMKKSMWRVDETGGFRFFDRHEGQMMLLSAFDQAWLAEHLSTSLAEQRLTVGQVKEYVLRETPCFQFVGALKLLERERRIQLHNAPSGRRAGSFAKYVEEVAFEISF